MRTPNQTLVVSLWASLGIEFFGTASVPEAMLTMSNKQQRPMPFNRFVEWTHNGGQRGRYSSMLSAPLRPIHGQRWALRNFSGCA